MIVEDDFGRHAPRLGALVGSEAPALFMWDAVVLALVVVLVVAVHAAGASRAVPVVAKVVAERGATPEIALERDTASESVPADAEYLPLVTVPAVYPRAAQSAGVEGRCIAEYTIQATGAVREVRTRDCTPAGVFERAAIEAARQFKYRPRVRAGEAVQVRGVRNEFVFALER